MKCGNCGAQLAAGAAFCTECGTAADADCPSCGCANRPHAKFCYNCGVRLASVAQGAAPSAAPAVPGGELQPAGERRQLTVLFADLAEYTTLSQRLDAEDLHEVVRAYQTVCAEAVARFGGHVAQYLGDGVLAYFGYPRAHEDDAARAVRTGLAIADGVAALRGAAAEGAAVEPPSSSSGDGPQATARGGLRQLDLRVRVGVHTGLVVMSELGGARREQLALGETPNVAARLQAIADPNSVVVSAATLRLVHGSFVFDELGPQLLKGLTEPIAAYRILRWSGTRGRLAAASGALTPLVGRGRELELLLERWQQVCDGRGQVVLLSGEGGIGKSRLLAALRERLAGTPHAWLECQASAYSQNSALHPFIELLRQDLRLDPRRSSEEELERLRGALSGAGLSEDALPLLAELLSLPVPAGDSSSGLSAHARKRRTLDALLGFLLASGKAAPAVLVVEDLHWLDPTSLELIGLLFERIASAPLLLALTFRPELAVPWNESPPVLRIALARLPQEEVAQIAERVSGGKPLPLEVLREIAGKTDGVPLFVEELTKMLLESGLLREAASRYELSGPLPPLAIPDTLQGSLMARLDRLGAAKQVAQLGAVIGREFPLELLRAISPLDDETLQRSLERLVDTEIVRRAATPRASYVFRHALLQEAAYQSLLRSARRELHASIARALAAGFAQELEQQPALAAHHLSAAGLNQEAVAYWHRAGQQSMARSAMREAIGYLQRGIADLHELPDSVDVARQDLLLHAAFGTASIAVHGYAAGQTGEAFRQVRALAERVGERRGVGAALFGLWAHFLTAAQYERAGEIADELFELGKRGNSTTFLQWAHFCKGVNAYWTGALHTASAELQQAIGLYDPSRHHPGRIGFMQDMRVSSLSYLALALCALGFAEQSTARAEEAVRLAEQLDHPYSLAFARLQGAFHGFLLRDPNRASVHALPVLSLCEEQDFRQLLGHGHAYAGWAALQEGKPREGSIGIERGLSLLEANGVRMCSSIHLFQLAEAHAAGAMPAQALRAVEHAIAFAEQSGERVFQAELHRLNGELLQLAPETPAGAAEVCFHRALEVARAQQAKAWELRAAVSLARLWHSKGEGAAARNLLAGAYGGFTEGFETAPLREARALLAALRD